MIEHVHSEPFRAAIDQLAAEVHAPEMIAALRSAVEAEALLRMRCFLHELKDEVEAASGSPTEIRAVLVSKLQSKIEDLKVMTSARRSLWDDRGMRPR